MRSPNPRSVVLRKLFLSAGSGPPHTRPSFGLADPVNLVLLLVAMAFYWQLSGQHSAAAGGTWILQYLP